ncbi:MAG: MFS transporter [Nitrospiria bacterium]
MRAGGYQDLLKRSGFQFFLWTQFLGAFNDNAFKMVVSLYAINQSAPSHTGSGMLPLVGAVFILPFLLFSGYAGHLADTFNKRTVLVFTKSMEIVVTGIGFWVFLSGRIELMLFGLFLMAVHSTFFSPAKYGVLPEMLPEHDLSRANGLLEMSTFLAIIMGTASGGILFNLWKNHPEKISLVLVAIAIAGTILSAGISKVSDPAIKPVFYLNPWREIFTGIRHLHREKTLERTVAGTTFFWFLGALLQMDLLLFGKETMRLDETRIGILNAFLAIGIGAGSLLAGHLSGERINLKLVPTGLTGMALFSLILSVSGFSYPLASLMLVFLGISGGLFIVPLNTLLQQQSNIHERGRLIATNNFLNMTGVLMASGVLWILRDIFQIPANGIILTFGVLMTAGAGGLWRAMNSATTPIEQR